MSDRAISDAIKKLSASGWTDELYFMAATVDSVDEDTRTCKVTAISGDSQIEIPDVKLQAIVGDGILIIPVIDSVVFVAYTKRNEPYVSLFSDVDKVLLHIGSGAVEITSDGKIKLNDGSYGGLIKIDELVNKLNAVENKVNDLISKFNAHTHTGVTTGGGTSGPTAQQEAGTLTNTQKSDLENTNITHGS